MFVVVGGTFKVMNAAAARPAAAMVVVSRFLKGPRTCMGCFFLHASKYLLIYSAFVRMKLCNKYEPFDVTYP